jgi:hypothetical protein
VLAGGTALDLLLSPTGAVAGAEPSREQMEFFEKKVRPVLVEHCYECHSAQAAKVRGGLLLDTRAGLRQGGVSGPAVVPGDAAASLLLQALRHEGRKMPPAGKRPDPVLADFQTLFYPNAYLYRDWVIRSLNADIPYDRFL